MKKRILYHACNAGCFVKCLIHKCLYYPDDDAVFIGYASLSRSFGKPDRYIKYLEYRPFLGPFGPYNNESPDAVMERIIKNFDSLLKEKNIKLTDFSDVYIGSYYGEFSFYINHNMIRHSIMEEGAGEWNPLRWKGYDTFNALIERYNMKTYDNDLVVSRIGIKKYWPKNNVTSKDINFEPYLEVLKLNEKDKRYFIKFFKLPEDIFFDCHKNNVLLLTQWYMFNGKKWTDDRIILMYQTILDYFLPDGDVQVYIKPHPADPMMNKYDSVKDCIVISSNCISEIMGLIPEIHFELALTVSSGSLATVSGFSDNLLSIGFGIVWKYIKLNKFYLAFDPLCKFIQCTRTFRYGIMDETKEMLSVSRIPIKDVPWHDVKNAGDSLVVCDRLKWSDKCHKICPDDIDESTIVAFLSIDEVFNYLSEYLEDIVVNSTVLKINYYYFSDKPDREEYVLCYSKSKNNQNVIKRFKFSKILKYQNAIMECYALDSNEKKFFFLENSIKKRSETSEKSKINTEV